MEKVPERDSVLPAMRFDVPGKPLPPGSVAFTVESAVQGNEFGVISADGAGDPVACHVVEIQVFEPVFAGEGLRDVEDIGKPGDARKDRGHEQDRTDSRFVQTAQGRKPSGRVGGARFEPATEGIVQRIERDGDFRVFQTADQVDVPQDQIGFGDDRDGGMGILQLF